MCDDMRSTPIQLNHGVILSLQSRVTITFRTADLESKLAEWVRPPLKVEPFS